MKMTREGIFQVLQQLQKQPFEGSIFAGFDGFVDTIVKPVRSLTNGNAEHFQTMSEFGGYLTSKAGKSCSFPLETYERRLGGNVPIFCNGTTALGARTSCAACIGTPEIDPVFYNLVQQCAAYSIGTPGFCTAFEFDDGKIMMAQNDAINKLCFTDIERLMGREQLMVRLRESKLLALLNWSELPHCSDIWKGLLNILCSFPTGERKKKLIVDLADCSGRSRQDILEMTELLRRFGQWYQVMITLNGNEAEVLGGHFGLETDNILHLASSLYHALSVSAVVIHTRECSYLQNAEGEWPQPTIFIEKPVTSTGSGDHFNAALAYGWCAGLTGEQQLIFANAYASAYVSTGNTYNREALLQYYSEARS